MKEVVLISDLWRWQSAHWISHYQDALKDRYRLKLLDSRSLAGVASALTSESEIHRAFVSGGIEKAVEQLLANPSALPNVIGFSIGGLIAWKAALSGKVIGKLVAVSSTRLRLESKKPPSAQPSAFRKRYFSYWARTLFGRLAQLIELRLESIKLS